MKKVFILIYIAFAFCVLGCTRDMTSNVIGVPKPPELQIYTVDELDTTQRKQVVYIEVYTDSQGEFYAVPPVDDLPGMRDVVCVAGLTDAVYTEPPSDEQIWHIAIKRSSNVMMFYYIYPRTLPANKKDLLAFESQIELQGTKAAVKALFEIYINQHEDNIGIVYPYYDEAADFPFIDSEIMDFLLQPGLRSGVTCEDCYIPTQPLPLFVQSNFNFSSSIKVGDESPNFFLTNYKLRTFYVETYKDQTDRGFFVAYSKETPDTSVNFWDTVVYVPGLTDVVRQQAPGDDEIWHVTINHPGDDGIWHHNFNYLPDSNLLTYDIELYIYPRTLPLQDRLSFDGLIELQGTKEGVNALLKFYMAEFGVYISDISGDASILETGLWDKVDGPPSR